MEVSTVPAVVPAHRLEVYEVVNSKGENLGHVRDLLLDMKQGRIAFAVVSLGGVLGFGDKWFALPWDIIDWSPEKKGLIVNVPKEMLAKAPGLDKSRWPQDIDSSWLSDCKAHFGCPPQKEAPDVTKEQVKELAFSIWEKEGKPKGKDVENYYEAERMLKEQESHQKLPQQSKSSAPPATPGPLSKTKQQS